MSDHYLIITEPFLARAESREEAYAAARNALPGAQIKMQRLATEQELIEYAEYLSKDRKV